MKLLIHIAACLWLLAACTSTKKTVLQQNKRTDSSVVLRTDSLRNDSTATVQEKIKDTVITVAGNLAVQVIPTKKLQPGTSYRNSAGHVHNTVSTDSAGNVTVECKADSLLLVVRNLTERITVLKHSQNRQSNNNTHILTASKDVSKTEIEKAKTWLAYNWKWLAVLVALVVLIEIVYRTKRKLHPPNPFT